MKTSDEITAIKMTIKTLSVKVKRIENVNKKLKKFIAGNEPGIQGGKVAESSSGNKLSYLERFDYKNRVQNLSNKDL